jgi:hypothetical protein
MLGFNSIDPSIEPNDWMTATLATGLRRQPDPIAVSPAIQASAVAIAMQWALAIDAFQVDLNDALVFPGYDTNPTKRPEMVAPYALDYTQTADDSSLAARDFDLAEPMPLGDAVHVLIGGDGQDLLVGEEGTDLLIGGFA